MATALSLPASLGLEGNGGLSDFGRLDLQRSAVLSWGLPQLPYIPDRTSLSSCGASLALPGPQPLCLLGFIFAGSPPDGLPWFHHYRTSPGLVHDVPVTNPVIVLPGPCLLQAFQTIPDFQSVAPPPSSGEYRNETALGFCLDWVLLSRGPPGRLSRFCFPLSQVIQALGAEHPTIQSLCRDLAGSVLPLPCLQ